MKDTHIGKVGTKARDEYEYTLRMDVLGKMIKVAGQDGKKQGESGVAF